MMKYHTPRTESLDEDKNENTLVVNFGREGAWLKITKIQAI